MTETSRRLLLSAALVGPALLHGAEAAAQAPAPTVMERTPLVHHALFWLENPQSKADRDELVAGLNTLRGIPQIKHLHIGVVAATERRDVVDHSFDVSELMFFDTLADQAQYQSHPIHQAFIAKHQRLWKRVVVYDASLA